MLTREDWIAATGLRAVSHDPEEFAIPDAVLSRAELSLMAKGLYSLVLAGQGQPVNPYEDAVEDSHAIHAAIDELISAGLVRRVQPLRRTRPWP